MPDIFFIFIYYSYLFDGFKLAQFLKLQQKKVLRPIKKRVFQIANYSKISIGIYIFISYFVNKIKNQDIEKIYKKSKFVI